MFLLAQVLKRANGLLQNVLRVFAVLGLNSLGSRGICVLTSWIPAGINSCLEAAASSGCCSGPMDGETWQMVLFSFVLNGGYGMILNTPLQRLGKYEKIMKYLSKLAQLLASNMIFPIKIGIKGGVLWQSMHEVL